MNLEAVDWRQRSTQAPFHARLWGDFAIADPDGADTTPRGRKARALLAWLALHAGRPISRERLCGLLWGDRGEEQARASLRQTLLELRPFTTAPAPLLLVTRQSVMLDPARLQTDVDALAQGNGMRRGQALPDADEIFLGNMDGVDPGFDDWLRIERTRQRDRLEQLLAAASAPVPPQPQTAAPPRPDAAAAAGPAAPPRLLTGAARRSPITLLALVILALVIAAGAWQLRAPPAATAPLTIAVMPFDDLSGTDKPYLAEGVSEEILNRLAGNPRLKVLGRTSAASLRNRALDARAIGRRLGVAYLVEGSVRSAGPQLRVVVALVRSEDGARLWSQQYDGKLANIFAIQDQIGENVASRLRLPAGVRPEGALTAKAGNYALYLQARGMLRDANPDRVDAGLALLHRVLRADPRFAAAWAELGSAHAIKAFYSHDPAAKAAGRQQARAAALRALALNPRLARAHLILGNSTPDRAEARTHLEAAVRLDPRDAENWYFLHFVFLFDGDYPRALDLLRRAVAIDPLWWPAFHQASSLAWEMGYREEAEAYARRVEEGGWPLSEANMVRNDMAWRRGDFSLAFAEAQRAWQAAPADRRFFAELGMSRALRAAGRHDQARPIWHRYPLDPVMMAMWKGQAPGPATTSAFIARADAVWQDEAASHFLLATLWSAGRMADIVRLYDARFAAPAAMRDTLGPNARFVALAMPVAAGLRAVGRAGQADQLVALATTAMQRMTARGPLPIPQLKSQAALLAATGQHDAAIAVLQRAHDRGHVYTAYYDSFRDMALDPAFQPIRDDPRFQAIRRANLAHTAREAREIAGIAIDPRLAARFAGTMPAI